MAGKRNVVLSVIVRVFVAVVLISAASAIFSALWRTRPQPSRSTSNRNVPRVLVMPARQVEVRRQWDGYGTARAMDSADVPARVTATVVEIPEGVIEGAWVEAGDLLVRLDDSDFARQQEITEQAIADIEAQLARLEVEKASWAERIELADEQVKLAEAEFERVASALKSGAAKQREVDNSRQALLSAIGNEVAAREEYDKLPARRSSLEANRLGQQAQLRLAQQNVERCRIVSPLTGVLQSVDVEVGENLAAGQRVARVVDLRRIEVPLRLPSSARAEIRVGDGVVLRATGSVDRSWAASAARIAPEDDQATRTMAVYVEIAQEPAASGGLAPGQFVRGTVRSFRREPRWVAPRRALNGDRIQIVRDGRIESREVAVDFRIEARLEELGVPDEQWVVLREPLNAGELIMLNASRMLADGTEAQPVQAEGDAASAATTGGEASR